MVGLEKRKNKRDCFVMYVRRCVDGGQRIQRGILSKEKGIMGL